MYILQAAIGSQLLASVGIFSHLAHSAESLAALGTVPGNSYCFSAPAKVEQPKGRLQGLQDLRNAVFASVPKCVCHLFYTAPLPSPHPTHRSPRPNLMSAHAGSPLAGFLTQTMSFRPHQTPPRRVTVVDVFCRQRISSLSVCNSYVSILQ